MNNIDLKIDQKTLEACLQTIHNIGSNTLQNICTGKQTIVVWGLVDWFFAALVGMLIVLLLGVVILLFRLATE